MGAIADNLAAVRMRIAAACERTGREPNAVTLVGVSKTHGADVVATAYAAGLRDFGENRVQEGVAKVHAMREARVRPTWHLIGHLQTNKVRAALEAFDILHGIDSERLAEAVSRVSEQRVPLLIEVNVSGEASKFGVEPNDVARLAARIGALPNIDLRGLMTVAPEVDDPQDVRSVFRALRELAQANGLRELSMGMTDDFEVAVEEGSTLVRVGRAIFGARVTGEDGQTR